MTELEKISANVKYGLKPINREHPYAPVPVNKKRLIIGRSENCDIAIPFKGISMVHAVLEVSRTKVTLYDMNSKTHCYVNGNKVIAQDLRLGDVIRFGNYEYYFDEYHEELELPPVLSMLKEEVPKVISKSVYQPARDVAPAPTRVIDKKTHGVKLPEQLPSPILYPLAKDLNADDCEYIFEDAERLLPIISYDVSESAIEIIILYKDTIHSVDYLPKRDAQYYLTGFDHKSIEVEYPVLSKNDRVLFVEVVGGDIFVKPLPGHELFILADENSKGGKGVKNPGESLLLGREDIVRLTKNDVQVFVRATPAPPYIKSAPFFTMDSDFRRNLLLVMFFLSLLMTSLYVYEVDKEVEKEKAPERVATILYNKKKLFVSKEKAVAKTIEAPKVVQMAPPSPIKKEVETPKVEEKKQEEKKVEMEKPAPVKAKDKPQIVKKAEPNKAAVDKKAPIVTPQEKKPEPPKEVKVNKPPTPTTAVPDNKPVSNDKVPKRINQNVNLKAQGNQGSKGHVQTYKSFDFSANLSSLLAKGGSTGAGGGAGGSPSAQSATIDSAESSATSSSDSATLKRANTSGNIGSLAGAAQGSIESSSQAGSLVSKKGIYHAGMPFKTVVLGGLDPNDIRRILAENIDKFRYCYQRALDTSNAAFDGIVTMDFIIGASGHVTKAAVKRERGLPDDVKKCVVNVLKGIQFPEPPGGGVVEVRQPFNFYPEIR